MLCHGCPCSLAEMPWAPHLSQPLSEGCLLCQGSRHSYGNYSQRKRNLHPLPWWCLIPSISLKAPLFSPSIFGAFPSVMDLCVVLSPSWFPPFPCHRLLNLMPRGHPVQVFHCRVYLWWASEFKPQESGSSWDGPMYLGVFSLCSLTYLDICIGNCWVGRT